MSVIRERDLREAMANSGVNLDESQMINLMQLLDPDHDGLILWDDIKAHFQPTADGEQHQPLSSPTQRQRRLPSEDISGDNDITNDNHDYDGNSYDEGGGDDDEDEEARPERPAPPAQRRSSWNKKGSMVELFEGMASRDDSLPEDPRDAEIRLLNGELQVLRATLQQAHRNEGVWMDEARLTEHQRAQDIEAFSKDLRRHILLFEALRARNDELNVDFGNTQKRVAELEEQLAAQKLETLALAKENQFLQAHIKELDAMLLDVENESENLERTLSKEFQSRKVQVRNLSSCLATMEAQLELQTEIQGEAMAIKLENTYLKNQLREQAILHFDALNLVDELRQQLAALGHLTPNTQNDCETLKEAVEKLVDAREHGGSLTPKRKNSSQSLQSPVLRSPTRVHGHKESEPQRPKPFLPSALRRPALTPEPTTPTSPTAPSRRLTSNYAEEEDTVEFRLQKLAESMITLVEEGQEALRSPNFDEADEMMMLSGSQLLHDSPKRHFRFLSGDLHPAATLEDDLSQRILILERKLATLALEKKAIELANRELILFQSTPVQDSESDTEFEDEGFIVSRWIRTLTREYPWDALVPPVPYPSVPKISFTLPLPRILRAIPAPTLPGIPKILGRPRWLTMF